MGWGTGTNRGKSKVPQSCFLTIPSTPEQPPCRRRKDEGGHACSVLSKPIPDIFPLAREHLGLNDKATPCFPLTRHLNACAQKVLPWAESANTHKSCDSNNVGSGPHSMELAEAEDGNDGSTDSWASLGNLECPDKSSRRMSEQRGDAEPGEKLQGGGGWLFALPAGCREETSVTEGWS